MSLSKNCTFLSNARSGKHPQILMDENIFRFKSNHLTMNGEVKYFECSQAKNGCLAKLKCSGEEITYMRGRNVHNHLNNADAIGVRNLKTALCKRAASKNEITKGLRQIFDLETENNPLVYSCGVARNRKQCISI
jgi:hypothetical protein